MAKKKQEVKAVVNEPNRVDLVRAIRLTWDSLDSHLNSSVSLAALKKCCATSVGDEKFHRMCVKEYADIISVLAAQL